jgi:hypothetical protein
MSKKSGTFSWGIARRSKEEFSFKKAVLQNREPPKHSGCVSKLKKESSGVKKEALLIDMTN